MANSAGQSTRDPLYLADATVTYSADEFRNLLDAVTTAGRRDALSFQVTQHAGTANMSVDIAPGVAVVAGTTSGAAVSGVYPQGLYVARLDATCSITIPTAPGSGSRTDNIYLQIADKTVVGSGNNEAIVKIQSPAGTLPVSSLLLATVVVTAGQTQIFNAAITNTAIYAQPAVMQASINAAVTAGTLLSPYAGWRWAIPAVTAPYSEWLIASGGANLAPGSNNTVSMIAGHLYLITCQFSLYSHVAGTSGAIDVRSMLYVDGVNIQETFNTVCQVQAGVSGAAVNIIQAVHLSKAYRAPTTGGHTIGTYFAASAINGAGVIARNVQPVTEVYDMGIM